MLPYYNKPTPEGQYRHFKAIHDAVDIPIIIYNVPPRTAVDMNVETMARCAKLPRVIGVKDATADLARPMLTRIAIGPQFCQLSGEDGTVVPFLAQGGHGCISVTANVAPRLCSQLHKAWQRRDLDTVNSLNERLMPLHKALFVRDEPRPGEIRRQPARPRPRRGAPADLRDRRPLEGGRALRHDLGRIAELMF